MIIRWPVHVRANCRGHDDGLERACCVLFLCRVCLGAEASLPTDCPGVQMTQQQDDMVLAGELDFRSDRGWVSESNSPTPSPRRSWAACLEDVETPVAGAGLPG